MKRIIAISLVCLLSACSINYRFNGASIDYTTTKTMSIANFPIKAALVYPPLGPAFNEALQDIFTRQTRLNMVSSNGDLQLEGEITNYALSPQAVGEDAYATKTRLTISVSIRFTNTKDPSQDKSQSFSDYRDFDSTQMLNDVQDELIAEIVEWVADQIFNATVANW